jgi:L-amino acid N-acyltransferase YncA
VRIWSGEGGLYAETRRVILAIVNVTVEEMEREDWKAVRAIYRQGIATGNATFETDAPAWEAWDASHRRDCRLVARVGGRVVGWAALSPVSGRCVYAGVAEVSVYVALAARSRGVGKALLRTLVAESERAGIWTLQGGIFPENVASIALHEACGFHRVGVRERIGQIKGLWRDVVLMERRSEVVGVARSCEA